MTVWHYKDYHRNLKLLTWKIISKWRFLIKLFWLNLRIQANITKVPKLLSTTKLRKAARIILVCSRSCKVWSIRITSSEREIWNPMKNRKEFKYIFVSQLQSMRYTNELSNQRRLDFFAPPLNLWEYMFSLLRKCLWCNGYPRRQWTRRHEFKSWTRLIAFHITLIPLGKVWIQLFSFQLWLNSRTD